MARVMVLSTDRRAGFAVGAGGTRADCERRNVALEGRVSVPEGGIRRSAEDLELRGAGTRGDGTRFSGAAESGRGGAVWDGVGPGVRDFTLVGVPVMY